MCMYNIRFLLMLIISSPICSTMIRWTSWLLWLNFPQSRGSSLAKAAVFFSWFSHLQLAAPRVSFGSTPRIDAGLERTAPLHGQSGSKCSKGVKYVCNTWSLKWLCVPMPISEVPMGSTRSAASTPLIPAMVALTCFNPSTQDMFVISTNHPMLVWLKQNIFPISDGEITNFNG